MSNEQFKRNFAALLKRVGDKSELVVRKVAIELQTSMIIKSPVDSGRFKGNWQCSVGAVLTDTGSPEDKTKKGDFDKTKSVGRSITALKGWRVGQTIWLTNSLPYSRRLEYGWSKQAPGGIVRLTVQEYSTYLKKVVEQLK